MFIDLLNFVFCEVLIQVFFPIFLLDSLSPVYLQELFIIPDSRTLWITFAIGFSSLFNGVF